MAEKQTLTPRDHSAKKQWVPLTKRPWFLSILSSLLAIVIGLLAGLIVLVIISAVKKMNMVNPFIAFWALLTSGLKSADSQVQIFYMAAPLVLTGLAVAFTFKAGSFNIGGPGQFIAGGVLAIYGAVVFHCPWYVDIIFAMLGGALWGFFPGLLKALFNVNEVLSAIMLNWIAVIVGFIAIKNTNAVIPMIDSASAGRTVIISNVNTSAIITLNGDYTSLIGSMLTIFALAIIFAFIAWIILEKTTLGFEIKACGFNKEAAKYAGIKEKKNIILAFTISGLFAGLGAALYYLSPASVNAGYKLTTSELPSQGFDGISVALLAANNPLGCLFSALFISYLKISGSSIQIYSYSEEVISVIIGVIIYCASFVAWIKDVVSSMKGKKAKEKSAAAGAAATASPAPSAPETHKPDDAGGTAKAAAADQDSENLKPFSAESLVSASSSSNTNHQVPKVSSLIETLAAKTSSETKEKEAETASAVSASGASEASPAPSDPKKAYAISGSPFTRDLKDYKPDNPQNDDFVPLERQGERPPMRRDGQDGKEDQ
jgi:ABC-type uncharacterized transport system permease subunit